MSTESFPISTSNTFGTQVASENERIKIWKAEITDQKGKIGITLNDNLLIACKNFAIQVLEIQRPGKKIQKVKEFLLGYKIPKASKLF